MRPSDPDDPGIVDDLGVDRHVRVGLDDLVEILAERVGHHRRRRVGRTDSRCEEAAFVEAEQFGIVLRRFWPRVGARFRGREPRRQPAIGRVGDERCPPARDDLHPVHVGVVDVGCLEVFCWKVLAELVEPGALVFVRFAFRENFFAGQIRRALERRDRPVRPDSLQVARLRRRSLRRHRGCSDRQCQRDDRGSSVQHAADSNTFA